MNGKNGLARITPVSEVVKRNKLVLRPLPGLPVVRDLVVDMSQFYNQYAKVQPYLVNKERRLPLKSDCKVRKSEKKLDGLYECILCACCSTSCPSFWWNPDKFIGPAGLFAGLSLLSDSRTQTPRSGLLIWTTHSVSFRCRGIMNCVSVCPKGLNPTRAIGKIRTMLMQQGT